MSDKTFSRAVYRTIYILLMILLGATFLLAYVKLGKFNLVLSLLIASIKASLVVLFFMHLRISDGLHRVVAMAGLFLLGVLLSLAMSDVLSRDWLLLPGHWPSQWPK